MGDRARICVLEDDAALQRLIAAILEQDGMEVLPCPSGEELICAARTAGPHLALVDIGFHPEPELTTIRQLCSQLNVRVLAMSTGGAASARGCIEAGADDFLRKPFDPDALLDRVCFLLSRPEPSPQEAGTAVAGPITIDLGNRVLKSHGHPVHISRTEWDLLHTLAVHAREPVFHGDLARRAFDAELRRDEPYLRLWMARLSDKLGQDEDGRDILLPFHNVAYILNIKPPPSLDD
ncbi:MAG TPA: response regulator transcription factor [Dehalococcoidia bacterium]|nr:response regulator transcription factor [Dehalococcoidia bacterium]